MIKKEEKDLDKRIIVKNLLYNTEDMLTPIEEPVSEKNRKNLLELGERIYPYLKFDCEESKTRFPQFQNNVDNQINLRYIIIPENKHKFPQNMAKVTIEPSGIYDIERIVLDRKSTRLNSSHIPLSRMPSSA